MTVEERQTMAAPQAADIDNQSAT